MKTYYSIIIIFILIYSQEISAQYYENSLIKNVPYFVAKCEVNKSIRDKDAEILASNKVREVWLKNNDSKPIGKLVVNAFGYIEDFYTYKVFGETFLASKVRINGEEFCIQSNGERLEYGCP